MFSEKKLGALQLSTLLDIHEKRLFPVHQELRLLLYIGLLMIIAGVGLTNRRLNRKHISRVENRVAAERPEVFKE